MTALKTMAMAFTTATGKRHIRVSLGRAAATVGLPLGARPRYLGDEVDQSHVEPYPFLETVTTTGRFGLGPFARIPLTGESRRRQVMRFDIERHQTKGTAPRENCCVHQT
jgi:hypothetical protein